MKSKTVPEHQADEAAEGEFTKNPTPSGQLSELSFGVCITTMNRTLSLEGCLHALAKCEPPPTFIAVSDDSQDPAIIAANRRLVSAFENAVYLTGPHNGVCGNRNSAVKACLQQGSQYVAFVDDDVHLQSDFFSIAAHHYLQKTLVERGRIIITGASLDGQGRAAPPTRLSFSGYFIHANTPENVDIHAAVFPAQLFHQELWDENIFFGAEDAELCLRAKKAGFEIEQNTGLMSVDTQPGGSTLLATRLEGLTKYQLHIEAARLYIGVKRYMIITPNPLKLTLFLILLLARTVIFLIKNKSIILLPKIVKISNIKRLFN